MTMARRDKWIPWYFVAFFAVVGLVDAVMVTLAVRTQTGTVTSHAYEKGLQYNTVVAAAEAQEKLGWQGQIVWEPEAQLVRFALKDKTGKALSLSQTEVLFRRPTQAGLDFTMALQPQAEGAQAKVAFPKAGLWEAVVKAQSQGQPYQFIQRMVIEP